MNGLLFDLEEQSQDAQFEVNRGDVWRLGNHVLMCGDSTSQLDVELLMGKDKADLVFTDPPYGMGKERDGVMNDNQNSDKLVDFNRQWIGLSFAFLKDNGSWYCWGTDESCMDIYACILRPLIKQGKIVFRNMITWWKGEGGLGVGGANLRCYPSHSEKCLFAMKGNKGFTSLEDYKIPFCDELLKRFAEYGITPLEAAERVCANNKSQCEKNTKVVFMRLSNILSHIQCFANQNRSIGIYGLETWMDMMISAQDMNKQKRTIEEGITTLMADQKSAMMYGISLLCRKMRKGKVETIRLLSHYALSQEA